MLYILPEEKVFIRFHDEEDSYYLVKSVVENGWYIECGYQNGKFFFGNETFVPETQMHTFDLIFT